MLIHQPESPKATDSGTLPIAYRAYHQLWYLFELVVSRNCQETPQSQEHVNDSVRCESVGWCKLWQPRWDTRSKDLCSVLQGQEVKCHVWIHRGTQCHDMSRVITLSYSIPTLGCLFLFTYHIYIHTHIYIYISNKISWWCIGILIHAIGWP